MKFLLDVPALLKKINRVINHLVLSEFYKARVEITNIFPYFCAPSLFLLSALLSIQLGFGKTWAIAFFTILTLALPLLLQLTQI